MFKRESYKVKMREIGILRNSNRSEFRQKAELVRPKRCHSNNPNHNKRQLISVIDNFINKINDRRKTSHSSSESTSSSGSSASIESTKTSSDQRDIKSLLGSPRLILKSTQNYIRTTFKRPRQTNSLKIEQEKNNDLFIDHFNSIKVEELENSPILKSLLDSQQFLNLQKSLSQNDCSNQDESSCSESSNSSCIVHDCSNDSDSNSNVTFVEHSDDSFTTFDQTNLPNEPKSQMQNSYHSESYAHLLAKLEASYLKSPSSIVNKGSLIFKSIFF